MTLLRADWAADPSPAVSARIALATSTLATVAVHVDMGLVPPALTTPLRNAWIVKPNHLSKGNG